jgi:hypothetical protein
VDGMENRPKLQVSGLGWDSGGETRNFEEARLFPYGGGALIAVEGQVINSYEELVKLADQEPYKYKEYLEVIFLPIIVGG